MGTLVETRSSLAEELVQTEQGGKESSIAQSFVVSPCEDRCG